MRSLTAPTRQSPTDGRDDASLWAVLADPPISAAIFVALALSLALTWPRAELVWTTGAFFDSDDAMRAVQLRDLLAGQSWFDMTATRLDPPNGLFMHWSRIVDVPLAALEWLFGRQLSAEMAERAARLVFPFVLLAALYALAARNARILGGEALRLPAIFLMFLSGATFGQFTPGRIDHHAPQIILLMASTGFYLQGLDPLRARGMAFSVAAMALSFAISLENLPFFVVMLVFLPALFVVRGAAVRAPLAWFAAGALAAFPLCFVATIAPARYIVSTCDAFSTVHLVGALAVAVGFLGLALAADRLSNVRRRLVAAAVVGGLALFCVIAMAPQCVGDPLVGLDPLLRELWLAHVVEAKPLSSFLETSPRTVATIAAPIVMGLIAALNAAWRGRGAQGARWLALALLIGVGFLGGLWQVRVFSSATPLAMLPLAFAAVAVTRRVAGSLSGPLRAAATASLCVALSPIGIALASPSSDSDLQGADLSCLQPRLFEPLKALPKARIVAPIEMGAHLLAHTPHSVFAAPYHRDNHGNRLVVDAFLAAPDEAEKILRAAGAELVLWCSGGEHISPLIAKSPAGLASRLAKGDVPPWLERAAVAGTPHLIFAIRKPE
jgi:hypothetical protein